MAPSRNSSNFKNIRVEEIRRAGWFPTAIDIPMAARATLIHLAGQTGLPICGGIGNASISRSKHRSAVNDTQWLGDDKEEFRLRLGGFRRSGLSQDGTQPRRGAMRAQRRTAAVGEVERCGHGLIYQEGATEGVFAVLAGNRAGDD